MEFIRMFLIIVKPSLFYLQVTLKNLSNTISRRKYNESKPFWEKKIYASISIVSLLLNFNWEV